MRRGDGAVVVVGACVVVDAGVAVVAVVVVTAAAAVGTAVVEEVEPPDKSLEQAASPARPTAPATTQRRCVSRRFNFMV
jgi:hypothetical protein